MTDSTSSRKPSLPNVYSAIGAMPGYAGGDKAAGKPGGADAAATGEKVSTAVALLEVVKKMDKLETDPANKELIQQMVTLAQQYVDKVQGKPASAAATTGATEGMSPAAAATTGAGAGAGGGEAALPAPAPV